MIRSRRLLAFAGPLLLTASLAADQDSPTATQQPPEPQRLVDSITVTATSSPTPIQEIAGTVGRVERSEIESRLVSDARELLAFEPGVYVAGDPTRLGLGGFVIRGIGGNRVQTRIDGVPTAEQFAFGPFTAMRFTLDPETLQAAEIVRSAASSLYGSGALGGVVTLLTRDPADYLAESSPFVGARLGWDGRDDEASAATHLAFGGRRLQGSLALQARDGGPTDTQGDNQAQGAARTAPNPTDRRMLGGLGKLIYQPNDRLQWKLGLEWFDQRSEAEVFSARTFQNLGPAFGPGVTYTIDTRDVDADDRAERGRLSLETLAQISSPAADSLFVRLYAVDNETEQRTNDAVRTTTGGSFFGPLRVSDVVRRGLFAFEQEATGLEVQAKKGTGGGGRHLVTYGASYEQNRFDQLRDRHDFNAVTGAPVPPSVIVPTKYFPESEAAELGLYLQDEIELASGRVRLIPGLRYDRTELDADQQDAVFLAGNPGTPPPADSEADALSPKLGMVVAASGKLSFFAQYAHGFRTPPYSDVNNGFTNLTSGYRTLPNPDLDPETSDNFELGGRLTASRASLSLTLFHNDYDDFIELVALGVDPESQLLEYQAKNVASARIQGAELAGDARLGESWRLRGAFAWIEGENRGTGQPLNSIAPLKLVLGLDWRAPRLPLEAGLVVTRLEAKDEGDLDRSAVNQFATSAATVIDVVAGWRLTERLSLQGGVFNLLDETYWDWGNVGGLAETSAVKERYSAPGRNAAAAVRLRW